MRNTFGAETDAREFGVDSVKRNTQEQDFCLRSSWGAIIVDAMGSRLLNSIGRNLVSPNRSEIRAANKELRDLYRKVCDNTSRSLGSTTI